MRKTDRTGQIALAFNRLVELKAAAIQLGEVLEQSLPEGELLDDALMHVRKAVAIVMLAPGDAGGESDPVRVELAESPPAVLAAEQFEHANPQPRPEPTKVPGSGRVCP